MHTRFRPHPEELIKLFSREALEQNNGEPCLSVTVFPRVWIPERTRFEADSARLGTREFTTFTLRCPQFNLPATAVGSSHVNRQVSMQNSAPMNLYDNTAFTRLRYFFWRYLDWHQRLQLLVQADILPPVAQAPLPQTVEHLALERAKAENKMEKLWDLVMPFVPPEKRESNPFTGQSE